MRHAGIDEAGLGPTLGPLAIVQISATVDDTEDPGDLVRRLAPELTDSKKIYTAGRLAPLEAASLGILTWATGFTPATAAEVFALLGEGPDQRVGPPWMAGAEELTLPVSGCALPAWSLADLGAPQLAGHLLHPRTLNEDKQRGLGRSACELRHIQELLGRLPSDTADLLCDRLGGRRYYADALAAVWPDRPLEILGEEARESRYRLGPASGYPVALVIDFAVNGEARSPFTAMASCVAKYARELHMRLFNNYWSGRYTWLRPTAGYPQDAKRWLFQLGEGNVGAWAQELVRH